MTSGSPESKKVVRARLRAARRALPEPARLDAASAITTALLSLPEMAAARTVAAYVSIGTEPGTTKLLDLLRTGDVRVLLPVLCPDLDLDWAIYETRARLSPSSHGLWTPDGARLGVGAIAEADVVVAPALAVGADGTRLGQGGGCYDRALSRLPAGTPVVALLYEDELLPAVPTDPHDRRVTHVALPSGLRRVGTVGEPP